MSGENSRTEKWLKMVGLAFALHKAEPLGNFDLPAGWIEQSRPADKKPDPDLVAQYGVAMLDGDEFPAVIAYRGRTALIPICGNHRLAAAVEAGIEHFDVYVVEGDARAISLLRATDNLVNGRRPSLEEIIEGAMAWRDDYKEPVEHVAKLFRLSPNVLGATLRRRQIRTEFSVRGHQLKHLPDSTIERVGSIRNDRVQDAALNLIQDARLTTEMASHLASDVNKKRNEAAMLAVVKEWQTKPEVEARMPRVRAGQPPSPRVNRRARLFSLFGQARRLIEEHPTANQLDLTSQDLMELDKQVHWLAGRIRRMIANAQPQTVGIDTTASVAS